MDLPIGLIWTNICCAIVFVLYFYMQTCGEFLQVLSLFVAVPVARIVVGRMVIPVRIENGCGYPLKELSLNFLKFNYGVWSALLFEATRRIILGSLFDGVQSIVLMSTALLAFVFSEATGVCCTNIKNYKKGTIGFRICQWGLISISFLMGSSWVFAIGNSR